MSDVSDVVGDGTIRHVSISTNTIPLRSGPNCITVKRSSRAGAATEKYIVKIATSTRYEKKKEKKKMR